MQKFDLIVIGSGPAGEKAAAKAAYFGYKVALIEKEERFGGAGVQTGTLPSKTLKETALYLSGIYQKGIFGVDKKLGSDVGVRDFLFRKDVVSDHMHNKIKYNLYKHDVRVFRGRASLVDQNRVNISGENDEIIQGEYLLIATGSYPYHPDHIPFDKNRVHDSDSILDIQRFPRSICVLGAGVIGCEYATIFAAMGVKTYIVNDRNKILGFLDQEISEALVDLMELQGVEILFNDSVSSMDTSDEEYLNIRLNSGIEIKTDMFLFAAGRSGNLKGLNADGIGLEIGKRETLVVDSNYKTNIDNIYAVGDVIGFPALASTSMEQGRVAITHMFKTNDLEELTDLFPYGIYTVPEVSMVGITQEHAQEQSLDVETGKCYYRDTARGMILGDKDRGFLKLVFDRKSRVILGVHIIGHNATEIIHYGMHLVREKKSLDDVIYTVFNYPTLHALYKYASYDGLGNLSGMKVKEAGEDIV